MQARGILRGAFCIGDDMLKSCKYCGRVHDEHFICPGRQEAEDKRMRWKNNHRGNEDPADRFRHTNLWKKTRDYVYHRDRCLCLCCLAEMEGTERKYNTEELSVHHIIPLREDFNKRADLSNALTVCRAHHDMCEDGRISRDVQLKLVEWSTKGFIDLKERLEEWMMDKE